MKFFRIASLAVTLACTLGAAPRPLAGTFALQNVPPKTSASLVATPSGSAPLSFALDAWFARPGAARPIVAYDLDMTKLLHMVIVRADFRTFAHVHPVLGADGHFRISYRFPGPGVYHVYTDADPRGIGQQVFRFDVAAGASVAGGSTKPPALGPATAVAHAGPYVVTLDRTSLRADGETLVNAHVREGGRAARDLHPYLGAAAHAVFLNARDLTYVHVHPTRAGDTSEMPGMAGMAMAAPLAPSAPSPPDMALHVAVREPGSYKLWLEFRGRAGLEVAPFVLVAR